MSYSSGFNSGFVNGLGGSINRLASLPAELAKTEQQARMMQAQQALNEEKLKTARYQNVGWEASVNRFRELQEAARREAEKNRARYEPQPTFTPTNDAATNNVLQAMASEAAKPTINDYVNGLQRFKPDTQWAAPGAARFGSTDADLAMAFLIDRMGAMKTGRELGLMNLAVDDGALANQIAQGINASNGKASTVYNADGTFINPFTGETGVYDESKKAFADAMNNLKIQTATEQINALRRRNMGLVGGGGRRGGGRRRGGGKPLTVWQMDRLIKMYAPMVANGTFDAANLPEEHKSLAPMILAAAQQAKNAADAKAAKGRRGYGGADIPEVDELAETAMSAKEKYEGADDEALYNAARLKREGIQPDAAFKFFREKGMDEQTRKGVESILYGKR